MTAALQDDPERPAPGPESADDTSWAQDRDDDAVLAAEDPDDVDFLASNDQWAFDQADRLLDALPRMEGQDRRTEGEVFDHPTLMVLHKMLSQGTVKSIDSPISTGKEANVFVATTPTGGRLAVKIYRVNTATFKHVLQYIQGDERFKGVARDKRALVTQWAQKEFRNLHRLRDAGLKVPEPVRVLQNVLVTEFLGDNEGNAWPKLQELGRLDKETAQRFYDSLCDDYVAAYNTAGLVHADLSAYNILVDIPDAEDPSTWVPRIIDVGQAVLKNHPMAWEFLDRDIRNLVSTFKRHSVPADAAHIRDRLEHPDV